MACAVSTIKSMASKEGTEVKVFTYNHSEDAVVPDGWTIESVDHDRQMAVTRVTATRPYDRKRSEKEREEAAGPPATPTYPQPAGAVPEGETPPSNNFAWGSIDTTKVQNLEDLKRLTPTIAAQEAAGKLSPEDAEKKDVPQEAAKDTTEVATEKQSEANAESADAKNKADSPA